jgi:late competence protein required for DNA uptake (superfamily II DNA/RNA helicase)
MIKTQIIKVEPAQVDASFKYVCAICSQEHWVELREVSCDKFVIVCFCGNLIKPKTVSRIKILYKKPKQKNRKPEEDINRNVLKSVCKTLSQYGFSETEVLDIVRKHSVDISQYHNQVDLVKAIIKLFGDNNG